MSAAHGKGAVARVVLWLAPIGVVTGVIFGFVAWRGGLSASLGRQTGRPARTPLEGVMMDVGELPTGGLAFSVHIQDPSGHAMDGFCASLPRARPQHATANHEVGVDAGEVAGDVPPIRQSHVVFYGGSHTAGDEYTEIIRSAFQGRFGDAGHGFVFPVPIFEGFWQSGVLVDTAVGFSIARPSQQRTRVDYYGVAGARFETRPQLRGLAHLTLDGTTADTIRIAYLAHPNGGELEAAVGSVQRRVSTRATAPGWRELILNLTDDAHELTVRTRGVVKIFGVYFDRQHDGVRLDLLALTGSKARHHLFWDETMWAEMLRARTPNLIVMAYGNNEAEDSHLSFDEHVAQYERMMDRVRTTVPGASCLVIGPAYRRIEQGGRRALSPFTDPMAQAQQRIAIAHGCGFIDTRIFQGGAGGLARWEQRFPFAWLRDDGVHWHHDAYRRFGVAVTRALAEACATVASHEPT